MSSHELCDDSKWWEKGKERRQTEREREKREGRGRIEKREKSFEKCRPCLIFSFHDTWQLFEWIGSQVIIWGSCHQGHNWQFSFLFPYNSHCLLLDHSLCYSLLLPLLLLPILLLPLLRLISSSCHHDWTEFEWSSLAPYYLFLEESFSHSFFLSLCLSLPMSFLSFIFSVKFHVQWNCRVMKGRKVDSIGVLLFPLHPLFLHLSPFLFASADILLLRFLSIKLFFFILYTPFIHVCIALSSAVVNTF